MTETVTRLFPLPATPAKLEGLYLAHDLRMQRMRRPRVYANFIASIDGRISEPEPDSGRRRVPVAVANPRDWRLYLELAAQADAVLTTARHLRAVAAGRHQELLSLPDDLVAWRRARNLPPRPRCIALSRDLDLPATPLAEYFGAGGLVVYAPGAAPAARRRALADAGIAVTTVGEHGTAITPRDLLTALERSGYGSVYAIAGPQVLRLLIDAGALSRLYLTFAHVLLAGDVYDTIGRGPAFDPAVSLRLASLYLDPAGGDRPEQLYAAYDLRYPHR